MAQAEDRAQPSAKILAEVSALADGSLDPRRAAAVRELIVSSPELSERYERECRAVAALRSMRSDVAPARLRARIEPTRWRAGEPRPRLLYGGALGGALAVLSVALILLLPGGAPGSPSVSQAAALALRGPARGAPASDRAHPATKLDEDVQEVYFPNWSWFGWSASGQRSDHLGGRLAETVYYDHAGRRIAYTILTSPALRWPGSGTRWVKGTELQTFTAGGRTVVTWRRADHTCVLSGARVSINELLKLAVWKTPAPGS